MSKTEPVSRITGPQPSPKRKLSLPSLQTKRQRTHGNEGKIPANVSADADSAQDDALSLGTPAAAEGAEVAFIFETHHVSSPSSLDRSPDAGRHSGVATSPSQTVHAKTRQVCPAYDLRGHIKCRLYPDPGLRPELHHHSVLHSMDFDDMYTRFCRTRDLEFNYSDEVPGRLFSLVISTYGDQLGHVCALLKPVKSYSRRLQDHSCIDWGFVADEVGARTGMDTQSLRSLYFERIGPIVALWLREVSLTIECVKIEREFPAAQVDQGVPTV